MICDTKGKRAKGCKPTDRVPARRTDPRPTVRPAGVRPSAGLDLYTPAEVTPRRAASRPSLCAQLTPERHAAPRKSPRTSPHNRREQTHDASKRRAPQQRHRAPTPPPDMGGTRTTRAGGGEAHVGGVAHTQTAFSLRASSGKTVRRPRVGDRVVNVSGRGSWRVGVVVFVVPCGVQPRVWCSRRGFPGLFHAGSAPTCRERYVVRSGGVLYTPERVEVR